MKRLGLLWVSAVYAGALVWGMTGAGVVLIAGAVVFLLVFPQYVTVDPNGDTSQLDHLDGVGVGAR